jgi:hypothetical protein
MFIIFPGFWQNEIQEEEEERVVGSKCVAEKEGGRRSYRVCVSILSSSSSMGCTLTPGHKSGVERKSNEPDQLRDCPCSSLIGIQEEEEEEEKEKYPWTKVRYSVRGCRSLQL